MKRQPSKDTEWRRIALNEVQRICMGRPEFTTDAVWFLLDGAGVPPPAERRSMGDVVKKAARLGLCERTGRHTASKRPKCHVREVLVWKSLVYEVPV